MRNIFILVALIVAAYFVKPSLFDLTGSAKGGFSDDGRAKVVLFVHADCGAPCSDAKRYVLAAAPAAEVIDIKNDDEAERRWHSVASSTTLPLLIVGSQQYAGFLAARYDEVLYEALGDSALKPTLQRVFKHHFNSDGSPRVVMYGTSWCGFCAKARVRLGELGIAYQDWDVERDSDAQFRYGQLQASGYPLIYVGNRRVGAFDEARLIALLGP